MKKRKKVNKTTSIVIKVLKWKNVFMWDIGLTYGSQNVKGLWSALKKRHEKRGTNQT